MMRAQPRPSIAELFGSIQRSAEAGGTELDAAAIHESAQRGVATPASPLPHLDLIQRAFGRHDVSGVKAHVGGEAAASTREMGAAAYATGDHVVLGQGADLHTAAHEAAHVVQQRGGVQLKGGVGAEGDAYERHADAVADLVVQGQSAEALLDQRSASHGQSSSPSTAVQRMPANQVPPAQQVEQFRRRTAKLHDIVSQTHVQAISDVCKKHKYVIAIRETGPLSIRRIQEGAKAKPHTILEKTVKQSSIQNVYGAQADHVLNRLQNLDLDGFVGHWNGGNLVGIRVDRHPPALNHVVVPAPVPHVPIDLTQNDGGNNIRLLKLIPAWKTYLYTGDYDLHEAHDFGPNKGQIPEATPEKVKLLNRLNAGVAQADPTRQGQAELTDGRIHMTAGSDHAMFQHGDQATYRMNQHLESPGVMAELVRAVANESDEPMAWCRFGEWYVTLNAEEHQVLRDHFNLKKPHTWSPQEDARTDSGDKHTERYR